MLITAIEPRRQAMCALFLDGEFVMNLDARTLIEYYREPVRRFREQTMRYRMYE